MERKKLIYVAGPISLGVVWKNVAAAHAAGIKLLKAGYSVIVPHGSVFWGNLIRAGRWEPEVQPNGTQHSDWMGCDLEIVRRCDCLLRLPGESKGADMEVDVAERNGLPVYHSVEEAISALAR